MCFLLIIIAISSVIHSSAFEIKPRIVNGHKAVRGVFPYYAFLEIKTIEGPLKACGATLINHEWLVTAGHCLINIQQVTAVLGKSHLAKFEPGTEIFIIPKDNVHVHPEYFQMINWNDIGMTFLYKHSIFFKKLLLSIIHRQGLIRLPSKVKFTKFIKPVNMPMTCEQYPEQGMDVIAMGNGVTADNATISHQVLFAELTTLPLNICRSEFPIILLRKSILCAYNNIDLQSICRGDSGGPLVAELDDVLVGITSFMGTRNTIN